MDVFSNDLIISKYSVVSLTSLLIVNGVGELLLSLSGKLNSVSVQSFIVLILRNIVTWCCVGRTHMLWYVFVFQGLVSVVHACCGTCLCFKV